MGAAGRDTEGAVMGGAGNGAGQGVHTVLVVDDDFYAREAFVALLSRGERTRVWGTAPSVESAIEALHAAAGPLPDVILLDVHFGCDERAGIRGLPLISAASPDSKVLITSVISSESVVLDAIRAGADGYVWKNDTGSGIALAVERIAQGRFVMTPAIADAVIDEADALRAYAAEVLPGQQEYADLTAALKKTIYLFCFAGLSIKEIATELQVSPFTVRSRIKTAYQIIGAGSRQEAFARLVERERSVDGEG
jgi:DNA-binding NarL/FixJ family response regulator